MSEPLRLDVDRIDGSAVVRAAGEIDMAVAAALSECLQMLAGDVVVDLAEVTFLDSSGISVLVRQRNRLLAGGGQLGLRNPNQMIRRTIEIVGLGEWITEPESHSDASPKTSR